MGFVSESLDLIRLNRFMTAAKLIEQHLGDSGISPASKIGLMSWIGECYVKMEDRGRAAAWFEMAGRAALSCKELDEQERQKRALQEFEQALAYFEAVSDLEGMKRVAAIKYGMR
ncbi:MAG TPA: hypothetical protein VFF30_13105 [Nitrososphaerales archaeon]|nr:hypothetical protein [Nitrososphaerales archaeon]